MSSLDRIDVQESIEDNVMPQKPNQHIGRGDL